MKRNDWANFGFLVFLVVALNRASLGHSSQAAVFAGIACAFRMPILKDQP